MSVDEQCEALADVTFQIEGVHHFHEVTCLCGFSSHRSRSRTEHITGLVREAILSSDWLARVKQAVWDECLDAIEQNELNTQQAREGNPYRASALIRAEVIS